MKNTKIIEDYKFKLKEIQRSVAYIENHIETKAEREELELMRAYVNTLPKISDMKKVREYVQNSIEVFEKDNLEFHRGFENQN